jgi:hypothetical protein
MTTRLAWKNHALTIPIDSPVKFHGWGKDGAARFNGRFVLTGTFSHGCAFDCGETPEQDYYQLEIEPDAFIAAKLPHWENSGDATILIVREKRLLESIVSPAQRAALHAGKIPYVTGRTAIVVDNLETGLSCDAPYVLARFVALARLPNLARVEGGGVGTCA